MSKGVIGCICLVMGTSLGAGTLVIPILNSKYGLLPSSLYLLISWLIMTVSALVLAEVNLYFPKHINMFNMAKLTLGNFAYKFTIFIYLVMLNSLLSAYISGASEILNNALSINNIIIDSSWIMSLFVVTFGSLIFFNINILEKVNIVFLVLKFLLIIGVIFLMLSHVNINNYKHVNFSIKSESILILLASFGFSVIIPSIRTILNDDIKKIRISIIAGSIFPLLLYMIWSSLIMGVLSPSDTLQLLDKSNDPVADLTCNLYEVTNIEYLFLVLSSFSFICLLTSFFGVGLSLSDCITDGLQLRKNKYKILVFILTFMPSTLLLFYNTNVFLLALEYAGFNCVILQIIIPALMLFNLKKKYNQTHIININSYFLIILIILGISVNLFEVYSRIK